MPENAFSLTTERQTVNRPNNSQLTDPLAAFVPSAALRSATLLVQAEEARIEPQHALLKVERDKVRAKRQPIDDELAAIATGMDELKQPLLKLRAARDTICKQEMAAFLAKLKEAVK